jgi:hypothetical protein
MGLDAEARTERGQSLGDGAVAAMAVDQDPENHPEYHATAGRGVQGRVGPF